MLKPCRITLAEAHTIYKEDVRRTGGVKAWAEKYGVAIGYASEALHRPEKLGPKILGIIGIFSRKEVVLDLARPPAWFVREASKANPEGSPCSGG